MLGFKEGTYGLGQDLCDWELEMYVSIQASP